MSQAINPGPSDRKENAPLAGEARKQQLSELRMNYKTSSTLDQRSRLLEAIRSGPVTTFEARRYLDVPHPAGRVRELRNAGWNIRMRRVTQFSEAGHPHQIGSYELGGRDDSE